MLFVNYTILMQRMSNKTGYAGYQEFEPSVLIACQILTFFVLIIIVAMMLNFGIQYISLVRVTNFIL